MAKAKAAPMASTDVTVPRSVLKQFISLMDAIESADAIYKPCQSTAFRAFVHDTWKAPNIQSAYRDAQRVLDPR